LKVESAKPYGRRFLLKFEGICSLEQAEKLRGATLLVHEEDLPSLQEGEFFSSDLVGIRAFDTQGRYFGTVDRVMKPHNLDILVVQDEGRNEVLIPLLDTYVHKLSIEERLVIFDPACLP
jgi:16S rRNA processing protein RimM